MNNGKDIENLIEEKVKPIKKEEVFQPRNRAERRMLEKMLRKKNKERRRFSDSIKQAAEELTYIKAIQKVREIRERIEKEEGEKENEAATENN